MHRCKKLRRFVVQGMGDAPGLLLDPLVESAEHGVRFAERTMRHLERREALHEEPLRRLGRFRAILERGEPQHRRPERLVVQRGHLEDAEAVDDGLASELVRARERSLPCIVQVVLESTAVLLRKLASGLAQDMPPRYRATSTMASSVPLR